LTRDPAAVDDGQLDGARMFEKRTIGGAHRDAA
jgi:hypothetical protein